jgi:hypothetical protein
MLLPVVVKYTGSSPMPYALCPMPYAHKSTALLLRIYVHSCANLCRVFLLPVAIKYRYFPAARRLERCRQFCAAASHLCASFVGEGRSSF